MTPAVRFAVLYVARPQGTWSEPSLMLERTEYTREAFQSMLDRAGVDPGHPLRAWVAQERWPGDLWCVPHEAVAGIGGVACVAPQSSTVPRLEPLTRTADRLGPRKPTPAEVRQVREAFERLTVPPQFPPGMCSVGPPVLPGEQVILGGVAVGEPLSADEMANLDRAVAETQPLLTKYPGTGSPGDVIQVSLDPPQPVKAGERLHFSDGSSGIVMESSFSGQLIRVGQLTRPGAE